VVLGTAIVPGQRGTASPRRFMLGPWISNFHGRIETVYQTQMYDEMIPRNDGAGYDIVDVVQKGLDDNMIQQLMPMIRE
jgi:hypothetical protein